MIDINLIKKNPDKVKQGLANKGVSPALVEKAVTFYDVWTERLAEWEGLRKERNKIAHGSEGYSAVGKEIKGKLKQAEAENQIAHDEYMKAAMELPNSPADDVPDGKDEAENIEVKKWGEPTVFDFSAKDHLELGESLGLIDTKTAAKVSGTRFGYLKNEAVILEFALVQFALGELMKEGFTPILPPALINKEITEGLGYWSGGSDDYYSVNNPDGKSDFYLIGTAEHSLVPMHKDEVLDADRLPLRYVGFSTCFRREAGSYGKDTKGIFRVHQFDKLEMVSFIKPQEKADEEEHNYLLSLEEKLVQALGIPYQVTKMCAGDLGFPAARKYDLNCWFPSEGKYRETHSVSTCTDFQARRLGIKYREDNKTDYVHILNGTAFAIGRILLAILENFQQKDGSVLIPEALRPYAGGLEKISPKK